MATTLKPLLFGNAKLLSLWITNCFTLVHGLPSEMKNIETLRAKMSHRQAFEVTAEKSLINDYHQALNQLGNHLHEEYHANSKPHSFFRRQLSFFMVRAVTIITAMLSDRPLIPTLLVSLAQFLILPYSLFVSVSYGIVTSLMLFSGHILVFPCIKYMVDRICPADYNLFIPFSPLFLTVYLISDQLLCALCLYQTPKGKTKAMTRTRILRSLWYGFANCKSYYLVLIPLLFGGGGGIPVIAWLIDALFGCSAFVTTYFGTYYWELLFYHVHRMAHIRNVYPDAHKFHHYLPDSTAFDAHIYGAGAPEEWLILLIEVAAASLICGGLPPSMSYHVLSVSWYKIRENHTRADFEEHDWRNFHVDHHAKHNINFGFEYPLEMLFKTTSARARDHVFDGFSIKRIETERNIVLKFTPCKQT